MNQKRKIKSGLIIGVLVIVLAISALIGTTFAWFSDSTTSGHNKIISGRLDVGMNYWNSENGEYLDATNVPLFNENALWEPGYMEIAYLEIENRGTLAFNFLFVVYPNEETQGYLKSGEKFYLSDYLVYAIVAYDVEQKGEITTREEAKKLISDAKTGLTEETRQYGTMKADDESIRMALIVYMPEEITSEQANHDLSSGYPAPTINLSVDVYATQSTVEYDSFDNLYDAGLTPVWEMPIWRYAPEGYEVDEVNKKITINTPEALKYLGKLFDDMTLHPMYEPGEWEIVLGCDIDFKGEILTAPLEFGAFKSFNGNNKTITNVVLNYIYVDEYFESVGLFDELPSTKDLTLTNVTVNSETTSAGILAGKLIGNSYSNITVSDSSVSGSGFIGGLIGWGNFLLPIDFSGIQILRTDIDICGTGYGYAGGLFGYYGGGKVTVTNSTVSNLDASGVNTSGSYVGGFFGALDAEADFSESTVTEITIYKDVYIGSITGRIYSEKTVRVSNSTITVQASDGTTSKVINLTHEGDVESEGIAATNFPSSALHTTYNGHYYQVVQRKVGWNTASAECAAMYGHLATVTSAEENAALAKIVTNHGGSTWLGGVRSSENYNVFVWVTGEEMTYTNWASGEPNDLGGEQCIHMYANNGLWNDFNYNSTSATAYACEWDNLQSYLNYLTSMQ